MSDKTKAELVRENVRLKRELREAEQKLKRKGLLRRLAGWLF